MTSDIPTTMTLSNITNCGTSSNVLISGATEHATSTGILNVRTDYHSVGIHTNASDNYRLTVNGNVYCTDLMVVNHVDASTIHVTRPTFNVKGEGCTMRWNVNGDGRAHFQMQRLLD